MRALGCAISGVALLAWAGGPALAEMSRAQMSRGEYLTHAADCVACHSAPGATPYSGGRAFNLPMGVIYSPNITPDRETGIGDYTDDEWVAALQRGIGRGGRHLYPAMPYTSYTLMSRDDALAIKAYLFTLPAAPAPARPAALRFPFNQRWTLAAWNAINNPDRRFEPDPGRPAAWNRGAYLVQALGHCGQCHTPRNWMQGLSGREFAGGVQQGWLAYNLTADPAHGIGAWTDEALATYLSTGQAPGHGPASGPMGEAVGNSLRYLTPDDIHAIVTYLRTIPAQASGPETAGQGGGPADLEPDPLGTRVFAQACAGCHLPNGAGRQSPWAALGGDHSAADPAGLNAVKVLAHGSEMETASGQVFMHSFAGAYTDEELAAAANYVTAQFGRRAGHVTPQQVAAERGK